MPAWLDCSDRRMLLHLYHSHMNSPADRPDWSYALAIMGERHLFDEDDGAGPASCCPDLLPKKEVCVVLVYRAN